MSEMQVSELRQANLLLQMQLFAQSRKNALAESGELILLKLVF